MRALLSNLDRRMSGYVYLVIAGIIIGPLVIGQLIVLFSPPKPPPPTPITLPMATWGQEPSAAPAAAPPSAAPAAAPPSAAPAECPATSSRVQYNTQGDDIVSAYKVLTFPETWRSPNPGIYSPGLRSLAQLRGFINDEDLVEAEAESVQGMDEIAYLWRSAFQKAGPLTYALAVAGQDGTVTVCPDLTLASPEDPLIFKDISWVNLEPGDVSPLGPRHEQFHEFKAAEAFPNGSELVITAYQSETRQIIAAVTFGGTTSTPRW